MFASTIDVVGGYQEEADVPWDKPVCPTTVYGATKCWGEALGRVYSHQHGLSCICVRLCNPGFRQDGDWDPDDAMSGMSPRDAAQLLGLCIEAEDLDFAIVNGISEHRRGRLELKETRRILGFSPADGTAFPKRRQRENRSGDHDGFSAASCSPALSVRAVTISVTASL